MRIQTNLVYLDCSARSLNPRQLSRTFKKKAPPGRRQCNISFINRQCKHFTGYFFHATHISIITCRVDKRLYRNNYNARCWYVLWWIESPFWLSLNCKRSHSLDGTTNCRGLRQRCLFFLATATAMVLSAARTFLSSLLVAFWGRNVTI